MLVTLFSERIKEAPPFLKGLLSLPEFYLRILGKLEVLRLRSKTGFHVPYGNPEA